MDRFLISVITPTYNSEKYILDTIRSVQAQTFADWEMVIVDDCSTDRTVEIVEAEAKKDPRIRLFRQEENMGAAKARTRAAMEAKGKYVAYLDSDDLWKPDKLQKQSAFMEENGYAFSCTSYEVINDAGEPLNKEIRMLPKVDYKGFLTNNLLQTVGIMVNVETVGKDLLVMPDIRRRQDAATWLQILRAGYECYGLDEPLAFYRRTENSLSSNKIKAVKGMWRLYRDIEHLSLPFSCWCFARYAVTAVWKRVYPDKGSKKNSFENEPERAVMMRHA